MGTVGRSVALAMALENRAQGERIAELRDRKGLSQEELARRVGVSHGSVQNWEAGRGIRGANLRRVAEILETTPEEIRGDAEQPNPFSLAAHLDERARQFEQWSAEVGRAVAALREEQAAMRGDLDRQYLMLQQIFAKLATPEAAAELLEGAEMLEALAQRRAAAHGESSAAQAEARRQRRAG